MLQIRRLAIAVAGMALALLPVAGRAGEATPALPPEQAAAIERLIHDYLLNNPKVLIEAFQHAEATIKAEEAAATKAQISEQKDELENDPTSPVLGNPQGDVTIVEFFDYRCPYCKSSAPIVAQLLDEDKKLRLVLKEFPILGKESVFASRVAVVAQKHGKYAEFHKAMFALKTPVTEDATLGVAKSVGLDPAQVKKEMESSEIDAVLKHNYELARMIGADGTPAFVIGDTMTAGALSGEELRTRIAALRTAKHPS
jgi:protein-disulfide isomerase